MSLSRPPPTSQSTLFLLLRTPIPPRQLLLRPSLLSPQFRRHYESPPDPPPPKHTVLEQPDKFRPPSHPAKFVRLRKGGYGGGAYNQQSNVREKEAQKRRSYPHMFPEEGTWGHWVLTSRVLHVCFTIVSFKWCVLLSSGNVEWSLCLAQRLERVTVSFGWLLIMASASWVQLAPSILAIRVPLPSTAPQIRCFLAFQSEPF
jgi:hypothetical protein